MQLLATQVCMLQGDQQFLGQQAPEAAAAVPTSCGIPLLPPRLLPPTCAHMSDHSQRPSEPAHHACKLQSPPTVGLNHQHPAFAGPQLVETKPSMMTSHDNHGLHLCCLLAPAEEVKTIAQEGADPVLARWKKLLCCMRHCYPSGLTATGAPFTLNFEPNQGCLCNCTGKQQPGI